MNRPGRLMTVLLSVLFFGAFLGFGVLFVSCSPPPSPYIIQGPGTTGNEPPTLTILEPTGDLTRDQGSFFVIRWTDADRDSNAKISFSLQEITTNAQVLLVEGIDENDTSGPDSVSIGTSPIPVGNYHLFGTIDDDANDPVSVFALVTGAATQTRLVMKIVEPGTGPQTVPPVITVTEPAFNLSVAQDDILVVSVQPTEFAPNAANPFDSDSNMTLYILLDRDLDPNNDEPSNPNDPNIIVLLQLTVQAGMSDAIEFNIPIDLATIPPRAEGEPYFIRATADDATNPRVHKYAVGRISVVELAAGLVDLAEIGKVKAGARFYGFNPGAQTGSSISGVSDFDADGTADFVILARFGNPRNFGQVGEGYLIYGQQARRFGGALPVNAVSQSISGVILEGPPIRRRPLGRPIAGEARSDGLTSVSWIRDLSGDDRPEILIGLPRVHGAFSSQDNDPGDESPEDIAVEVEVDISVRQQSVTVSEEDTVVFTNLSYIGMEDVTISSATPNTNFGSDASLRWQDNGPGQRSWTLLKFRNILDILPDNVEDIDLMSLQADLDLRVFGTGGTGAVFQSLTDFSEQTRYNNFAVNGGDPVVGVDYIGGPGGAPLALVDSEMAGVVNVNIADLLRQLVDRILEDDEIRLIIVPSATEGQVESRVRSSEFNSPARDRPTLRVSYTRRRTRGAEGCYPDLFVNNFTSEAGDPDLYWHAGGMAVMINSQNRDSDSVTPVNTERLEATSIALELVGQESWVLDGGDINQASGSIFVRASNTAATDKGNETDEPGHISGARFVGGWYDYIDHALLLQPGREDSFGRHVSSIGDLNNDGLPEIVISAPTNERHLTDLLGTFGPSGTHFNSTGFRGSIVVIPGANYNLPFWRELTDEGNSSTTIPTMDQHRFPHPNFGTCSGGVPRNGPIIPADSFNVFAEDIDDMLGGAESAGDFNQDGIPDLLCGAYRNDGPGGTEAGAAYILYGRFVLGDFDLTRADEPLGRPPMLRIRGATPGDQIGWRQTTGLDVNGDRIDDVFISSPRVDFGGVVRPSCAGDFNRDGVIDSNDLSSANFNACRNAFSEVGEDLFSDDACKVYDYDNDGDIDDDDEDVFDRLENGTALPCVNLVDNGFVGVIFGGVFIDGDRSINQIATSDLPGTIFFGHGPLHRAGLDVSSAGDFNQDGFGDLLITAPGEVRVDTVGRQRLGVVYMVFGGTHLENQVFSLDQVGTPELPGVVFLSPYVRGRPNEAAPTTVAFIGDINLDGFGDIAIGNPLADFIDLSFPQGPDLPTDASVGRRRNTGDAYIVYGNNFGTNRGR